MEAALKKINLALQEAVDAFEGPLNHERLSGLQTTESLPDKQIWNLASQTVDLADKVVRCLQPPSLQLAESFLGKLYKCRKELQYVTDIPPSSISRYKMSLGSGIPQYP